MKNKILNIFKTIFLLILIVPMCIYEVKADNAEEENAGSSGVTDSGGSVSGDHGSYTTQYVGLRITLVDSSGNRIAGTVSVDYLSNESLTPNAYFYYSYERKTRKEVVSSGTTNWKTISESGATFNKLNYANFLSPGFAGGTYFENYFDDMDTTTFKKILNTLAGGSYDSLTSYDTLIKDGKVCRTVQEGYLLIEPIVKVWIGGTVQKHYFGTATEIIQVVKNAPAPAVSDIRYNTIEYRFPYAIYLSNDGEVRKNLANKLGFVPVTPPNGLGTGTNFSATKTLTKNVESTGKIYGVGIGAFKLSDSGIDFSCSKCWTTELSCDATECTNTNTNNERTCKKTVKEIDCEYVEDETKVNASGEKTFTYGSGCNLYCTEKAAVSYPGNVYPRVELGTTLIWPTANGEGVYPLTTTSTMTCMITPNQGVSMGTCISEAYNTTFNYTNSATGKLTYDNLSGKDIQMDLSGNCNTTQSIDSSGTVKFMNNCSYSLAENAYNAFDKETLKAVSLDKEAFKKADNYILSKERFLSIGNINKSTYKNLATVLDGKYKLQISNLSLGYKNQFTSKLDENLYICKYQVTDQAYASNKCVCPAGTKYAGDDLIGRLIEVNNNATTDAERMTCAAAQNEWCDDTPPPPPPYNPVCPSTSAYPGLSLVGCISDGYSEEECKKTNCYEKCPQESQKPGLDISECVKDKISLGNNKWVAYDICVKEKECYKICTGSNCIIYRTISLETPFVGKKADTNLWSASGSKNLMNFMHTAGVDPTQGLALYRFPGANWNNPKIVKDKIWYNRGYKASEIYQDATPLYTINLDPTSIKKIRKYNETHEYSDFTLKCATKNGGYCISKFLRSGITNANGNDILDYNESASTCANASNKATFISCYNK